MCYITLGKVVQACILGEENMVSHLGIYYVAHEYSV